MVGRADEGGVADHVAGGDPLQPAAPPDLLLDGRLARHVHRGHPRPRGQDQGRARGGQEHGRGQGHQAVNEGRMEEGSLMRKRVVLRCTE